MPRTKVAAKTEEQIHWINRGGPFITKEGVRIARGETFLADPTSIPVAFRDVIKPVDPEALNKSEQPQQAVEASFRIRRRGTTEFYDIYDGNKKRINEKDLSKEEAENVLSMLA